MIFVFLPRCIFVLFTLLLISPSALALSAGGDQAQYTIITAPELKEMISDEEVVVVHSLSRIEYEIQHIEGSINIPVVEMTTTDKLPADKTTPVVFYCMGKR
jgi:predicted sulfurtransferase